MLRCIRSLETIVVSIVLIVPGRHECKRSTRSAASSYHFIVVIAIYKHTSLISDISPLRYLFWLLLFYFVLTAIMSPCSYEQIKNKKIITVLCAIWMFFLFVKKQPSGKIPSDMKVLMEKKENNTCYPHPEKITPLSIMCRFTLFLIFLIFVAR